MEGRGQDLTMEQWSQGGAAMRRGGVTNGKRVHSRGLGMTVGGLHPWVTIC